MKTYTIIWTDNDDPTEYPTKEEAEASILQCLAETGENRVDCVSTTDDDGNEVDVDVNWDVKLEIRK